MSTTASIRTDYEVERACNDMAKRGSATRKLIDAADALVADLTKRLGVARDLLERVKVQRGAGSWTDEECVEWCRDYKEHMLGYHYVERPSPKLVDSAEALVDHMGQNTVELRSCCKLLLARLSVAVHMEKRATARANTTTKGEP